MNNFNDTKILPISNNNYNDNILKNLTQEKFINMANTIDNITLNGTNINDLNNQNNYNQNDYNQNNYNQNNYNPEQNNHKLESCKSDNYNNNILPKKYNPKNKDFIKSLTKEIITNIKENDSELYDSISNKSNKSNKSNNSNNSNNSNKSNKKSIDDTDIDDTDLTEKVDKKKNIKEMVKKNIETMIGSSIIPGGSGMVSWFFDECFNVKDFILLFALYFILSQDMIKDFFGKYFTSLNPSTDGAVDVKGVIVYGLILTVLYTIIKKFI